MRPEFEQQWRTARALENGGDRVGARRIYESLIRSDPERLYVRLRLSALDQADGNYRGSRQHALVAADTVAKGRWPDLAPVARRLLDFGECGRVVDLVSAADWNSHGVAGNSAALAQYLWLSGRPDRALQLADLVRPRAPDSHLLSYARANALQYCGRLQDATEEYERCLLLKPDYPLAHWSLAYHAGSEVAGARVERVTTALARLREDDPDRPYLEYALFKELDGAGDTDAAWRSLAAGARNKRRLVRYQPERERGGFEALLRVFGKAIPRRQRDRARDTDHVPIFIVGLPRTGTTLLERILGKLAGVDAGGELNDFAHALAWEANRFPVEGLDIRLVSSLEATDPSHVGRLYLQRTLPIAGSAAFLLDKNPANFACAGFIGRALPAARILCLRRSPMDACFSNLKELFPNEAYGYSYDLGEMAEQYLRFSRLCDLWQQTMPDQFMAVDYETLVRAPLAVTSRVAEFCGMSFDASAVDITRNVSPVSTASSSQVRQPINTRGIGAWRRYAGYLKPLEERLGSAMPLQ